MVRGSHENAAADFGAAGNIDDGNPFLADMFKEPQPGRGGPGFATGQRDAQAAEIVGLDLPGSIAHQAADDGRRDAEITYLMVLDQPPEPPGVGKIRRAFGNQQAGAGEARDTGAHRADHPTHVAEEEEPVGRFEIAANDYVAGDHRADEADMRPHTAFG